MMHLYLASSTLVFAFKRVIQSHHHHLSIEDCSMNCIGGVGLQPSLTPHLLITEGQQVNPHQMSRHSEVVSVGQLALHRHSSIQSLVPVTCVSTTSCLCPYLYRLWADIVYLDHPSSFSPLTVYP